MSTYLTHTPLESRKVTPAILKKYNGNKDVTTMEEQVQQYLTFLKYDGICALMFVGADGHISFKSRTNEPITCFGHVADAFATLPWIQMCEMLPGLPGRSTQHKAGVYFGEFWNDGMNASTVSGYNNLVDAAKLLAAAEQRRKVSFVVWDFVTWEEWSAGKSDLGFEKRMSRLDWMGSIGLPGEPGAPKDAKYPPIFIAPCEGIVAENKDFTSVKEMAEFAKTTGRYDGIILVDPRGKWQLGGRDPAKIKVKPTLTVDVVVVGYELGKGKYRDVIGKIVYNYKGKLGKCSGMTDIMRGCEASDIEDFFYANWFDQTIEVEAMEESVHGVLREPRFKRFRSGADKAEVDA